MLPTPDFRSEATRLAINEACDINDPGAGTDCTLESPCMFCANLAKSLEKALVRAFKSGQESMGEAAKLITPHRA